MITTTTSLTHTFGHTSADEPVTFTPHQHAHAWLVGGTGTGKTVAAATAAASFAKDGAEVCVFSFTSGDWNMYAPTLADQIITDPAQQANKVVEIYETLEQRYEQLREGGRATDFAPVILVLDNTLRILAESKDDLSRKAFFQLSAIARMGRAARVHMIAITQLPSAKLVPGDVRDQMGFRAQYGRLSSKPAAMTLWGDADDAAIAGQLEVGEAMGTGSDGPVVFTPTGL